VEEISESSISPTWTLRRKQRISGIEQRQQCDLFPFRTELLCDFISNDATRAGACQQVWTLWVGCEDFTQITSGECPYTRQWPAFSQKTGSLKSENGARLKVSNELAIDSDASLAVMNQKQWPAGFG
jgi:hypothetical protein